MVKIAKEIGIFLATGLLLVLLFNYLIMPLYINERNTVFTPNLEGLDIDTAQSLSKSEGIEAVVVDTIFTNDINPDIILEQFPAAGKEVKAGRAIKTKITSMNKKVLVPEINLGQLSKMIRYEFLIETIGLNLVRGKPFKISELISKIEEIL